MLLHVGDLLVDGEAGHAVVGDHGHMEADGSGGTRQQAAVTASVDRRGPAAGGVGGALALGGVVTLEAVEAERVAAWQLTRFTKVLCAQSTCQHVMSALRSQNISPGHLNIQRSSNLDHSEQQYRQFNGSMWWRLELEKGHASNVFVTRNLDLLTPK